jgi:hypothetical protein
MSNICITVAQRRVRDYTDESDRLMQDRAETLECQDCEAFLQHGINAYRWLRRAEEFLREADYQGLVEFEPDLRDVLDALYEAWMRPCEFAEKWIAESLRRGSGVGNLTEYRETCEDARELLQELEWRRSARRARVLLASEEDEQG